MRPSLREPRPEPEPQARLARDIATLRRVATLMDRSIGIPGTKWKIGLDGLIGLVPGVGDFLGFTPIVYYCYLARKHRLPRRLQVKMVWNQMVDTVLGTIPLFGDLFDFMYKAHIRNARLLEAAMNAQARENAQPLNERAVMRNA